jgi:hypothetical protein
MKPEQTDEQQTGLVPAMNQPATRRELTAAFQRGDVDGVVAALLNPYVDTDGAELAALRDAVQLAVELRRQNVAVIGSHEAFVRHTPAGALRQVIAPVRLSLAEGTLYQIPVRRQVNGQWQSVIEDPSKAQVSYQGLLRINAVAGCAVGMPPFVNVDGQERTNPYRQTSTRGDIERIVVAVNVVGPAPWTGNPVVVQYVLDTDPAKDLQHMLMELAKRRGMDETVFLIDIEQWEAYAATIEGVARYRWKWIPLYAGVGIAHDLRDEEVRKVYTKYVNLLQNALKKALTVARRNAMKAHPALAFHSLRVDGDGNATVRGTGWAANEGDMGRYMELMDRLARGLTPAVDLDLEVHEVEETYDPEAHVVGDDTIDAVADESDEVELTPEAERRNGLIAQIDDGLALLNTAQVGSLDYRPGEQTATELQGVLARLNAIVDGEEV